MHGCLTPKTRNAARLGLDMLHERTDDASFDPEDPKYHEQVDEWKKEITERVRERGTEHWLRRLREVGCPVAPVQFPEELSEHEQVKALGAMVSLEHPVTGPQEVVGPIVNFSKTKASVQGPSPLIGQHTEQLLLHGGLTRQEIGDLLEENIVR